MPNQASLSTGPQLVRSFYLILGMACISSMELAMSLVDPQEGNMGGNCYTSLSTKILSFMTLISIISYDRLLKHKHNRMVRRSC